MIHCGPIGRMVPGKWYIVGFKTFTGGGLDVVVSMSNTGHDNYQTAEAALQNILAYERRNKAQLGDQYHGPDVWAIVKGELVVPWRLQGS